MPEKIKTRLFDHEGMERTITRLAHEILERNRGSQEVVLVGIRTRGAPLADRLARKISQVEGGVEIPVGILDIALYRDDYLVRRKTPQVRATEIPCDINDRTVVLVDDVLFTGRTSRAAIDAILDYGRPARIQLAVLIDRGQREMPIQGDFIGKQVSVLPGEEVRVRLKEVDGADEAVIVEIEGEGKAGG